MISSIFPCRAGLPKLSVNYPLIGFGKRGLLEKGSFQKSPFSRDSREFRDSRDFRESPNSGKQRRIRPFSRDSREFRDSRDSRDPSSEKTPFVMTPFSGPELRNYPVKVARFLSIWSPGCPQKELYFCDPGGLLQNRETRKPRKWLGTVLGGVLRRFGVLEGVLARVLLLIPFQGKPPRSTLASTPASTPNFRSTPPSTLPSHFLDFLVSLFCSRPAGSQLYLNDTSMKFLVWKSSFSGGWGGTIRARLRGQT